MSKIGKILTIFTACFMAGQAAFTSEKLPGVFYHSLLGSDKPSSGNFVSVNAPVPAKDVFNYNLPSTAVTYPMEFVFDKTSFDIKFIDPNETVAGADAYYPGFRGTNKLIIYTPAYGIFTGTNEYGAEAVVYGNTVMKLTGANSFIPKDGFVISGHGKAKDWIQKNLTPGTKVCINPYNLTVTAMKTLTSSTFAVEQKIQSATQIINDEKLTNSRYSAKIPDEHISKASEYLEKAKRNPQKVNFYLNKASEEADNAFKTAIPFEPNEFKGIWLRPEQTDDRSVEIAVKNLKKAGIENVFLETFFHARTVYPSKIMARRGLHDQKDEFKGFDPLKSWCEHCKKAGINVHIWFECFYAGNKPPKSSMQHILSMYPSWANKTLKTAQTGEIPSSLSEHNGYFLDPANPEVRAFLLDIINEIITTYHPKGINLDYIRYPNGPAVKTTYGTNWGYTMYARREFKTLYGVDPIYLSPKDYLFDCWIQYRQNKITSFVSEVKNLTSANGVELTTVIFPDLQNAKMSKFQDWSVWSDARIVDGFTPLILTADEKIASNQIRMVTNRACGRVKIYPGIFVPFLNSSSENLLMQIKLMRKAGVGGVVLFDYAHLKPEYVDALSARIFNPKF